MKIREALEQDKSVWDLFVDEYDGDFQYYFDWKRVNENFGIRHTLLMIENDNDQLIGICPLIRKKTRLIVKANKIILFRDGISKEEKSSAFSVLFEYLRKNGASRCSSLSVFEEDVQNDGEYTDILQKQGFFMRAAIGEGLPCTHVLPLEAPFEDKIYKGLWSQKFRQTLNKVARSGIVVFEDKEFKYLNVFLDMLEKNYKRHHELPPKRGMIAADFNAFRNRTKLFVAESGGLPVVILRCFYTTTTCYLWQIGSNTKGTNDINKYCYKVAIEDACNNGYRYVNFGRSFTEGLARSKDRFKAHRIHVREYEKTYSSIKMMAEWMPLAFECAIHRPVYLWKNRKAIWDMITRFTFVHMKKERDGVQSIKQVSVIKTDTIQPDAATVTSFPYYHFTKRSEIV